MSSCACLPAKVVIIKEHLWYRCKLPCSQRKKKKVETRLYEQPAVVDAAFGETVVNCHRHIKSIQSN